MEEVVEGDRTAREERLKESRRTATAVMYTLCTFHGPGNQERPNSHRHPHAHAHPHPSSFDGCVTHGITSNSDHYRGMESPVGNDIIHVPVYNDVRSPQMIGVGRRRIFFNWWDVLESLPFHRDWTRGTLMVGGGGSRYGLRVTKWWSYCQEGIGDEARAAGRSSIATFSFVPSLRLP